MPSFYRDPNTPEPNVPRRIGVIAIIEGDGSVLVQHRADDGAWGLPRGMPDESATVLDELHGEVREETGLEITAPRLLGRLLRSDADHRVPGRHQLPSSLDRLPRDA